MKVLSEHWSTLSTKSSCIKSLFYTLSHPHTYVLTPAAPLSLPFSASLKKKEKHLENSGAPFWSLCLCVLLEMQDSESSFQINITHFGGRNRFNSTTANRSSCTGWKSFQLQFVGYEVHTSTQTCQCCCIKKLLADLIVGHNLNQFLNETLTEDSSHTVCFDALLHVPQPPPPPKISSCIFYQETVCGSRPSLSRDECNNFQSLRCSKGSPI